MAPSILLYALFISIYLVQSFEPSFYDLATINYGHLISSHRWIREKEEVKMLHAMEEIGFMVLTNHGISKRKLDDMWNVTKDFFDSTNETKHEVIQTTDYLYGYTDKETLKYTEEIEYFDETNVNGTIIPQIMVVDKKEMFAAWIGAANTDRLKDVRWPSSPVRMKEVWVNYYRECEKIATQLLKSFAIILELDDENYFEQFFDDHMSALRAINYPAQDLKDVDNSSNNSWRCSEHSDYGTFTLLRQDGIGGLQVETKENVWVDVISDKYDFIVNLGNTMKQWTNDRFTSNRHRVVNPRNEHESQRRQSIPFFHNPNGNAIIKSLKSCNSGDGKSKYEPIKFLDLLEQLVNSAVKM